MQSGGESLWKHSHDAKYIVFVSSLSLFCLWEVGERRATKQRPCIDSLFSSFELVGAGRRFCLDE